MVTNGVPMIGYIFGNTAPLEPQLSPNSTHLGFTVTCHSNRNSYQDGSTFAVLSGVAGGCLKLSGQRAPEDFDPPQKTASPPSKQESSGEKKCPPSLSRGWGDDIDWIQTYEEGLHKTRKTNKPLMVIHHLEDCQYSQALKKAFAENEEIQKMAKEDFIMLNLVFETNDDNLRPDQQYVPRIIFIDPSLTVRADITGKYDNRKYTYEPQDMDILAANMKTARKLLKIDL